MVLGLCSFLLIEQREKGKEMFSLWIFVQYSFLRDMLSPKASNLCSWDFRFYRCSWNLMLSVDGGRPITRKEICHCSFFLGFFLLLLVFPSSFVFFLSFREEA